MQSTIWQYLLWLFAGACVFLCGSRWLSGWREADAREESRRRPSDEEQRPSAEDSLQTACGSLTGLGAAALLIPWIAAEGSRALTPAGFVSGVAVLAIVASGLVAGQGDRSSDVR